MAEPTFALTVRPARLDDLPIVLDILTDAARRRHELGNETGWAVPFPEERVRPWLEAGEFYLAILSTGEPVGTFALLWEDLPVWGPQAPIAGYVHRFGVLQRHAGKGIGGMMLDWARSRTAQERRRLLRLDFVASNSNLRRYYERHGFRGVGSTVLNGMTLALYEREV